MEITFSRHIAPCVIHDLKGKRVGEIFPCHTGPLIHCPTCGNASTNPRVTGYGLQVYGRLFRHDGSARLAAKGKGGGSCFYKTRLRDIKQIAKDLFFQGIGS